MFVLHSRDLQSAPKTSNEGLKISYTMPNLFVLSLSLKGKNSPCFPWWGKELVGNFHNYIVLLKICSNLLSFSLWINTTQCFMENWDSLTLTLFGGKKKRFGLESFTLRSIILLFATQKLCLSSPLCLSLFEINKMFLDVEINTIIV